MNELTVTALEDFALSLGSSGMGWCKISLKGFSLWVGKLRWLKFSLF